MMAPHQPVLQAEVVRLLNLKRGDYCIDCTTGAGGHSAALLMATAPTGHLLGLDQDPLALDIAGARLAEFGSRVTLVQHNFDQLASVAIQHKTQPVQGILADLGVSSMQLDYAERGFSFSKPGPLDMRMGRGDVTAATLVNTLPETDLANLIYRYGEERKSRRIARAIVHARPLENTLALADIISKAVGGRRGAKVHPATRTFQALRIAVNDELGALERMLSQAIDLLAPGGRVAIISFHSLEDRLVKRFFQREASDCICPPEQPVCTCNHQAVLKIITRRPVSAEAIEIAANPRARSAKLRVAEKRED